MIINNNLSAMNAHRQLGINQNNMQSSMEKLSSGEQINRAGDDAAGLSISEKMRAQIRGLDQASNNAQDGISLIQTAEGALDETHQILQRMSELATQSANDTNEGQDRQAIQDEVDQLAEEIDRIARDTSFNNQDLLNGEFEEMTFHIGANEGQDISISIDNMDAESLGVEGGERVIELETDTDTVHGVDGQDVLVNERNGETVAVDVDGSWYSESDVEAIDGDDGEELAVIGDAEPLNIDEDGDGGYTMTTGSEGAGINVLTQEDASSAIDDIQTAIDTVSSERSNLGAVQNRLEHTISNLDNASENLQAAESRIRDVDMAREMMEFTQNNILSEASQSMLAQANQQPQSVLQLLQ
ncbi:flagellin [Salicibibacter cibi]|uniref:Flagellin n=1 Tax=Salicibibacter cibi TaxID=2743001 RepID=A0A7T6ZD80_9BACI|nr:flagellin [Salicibibacter cibi]QQK81130.1 flagellin [Salicibibacter cibi]